MKSENYYFLLLYSNKCNIYHIKKNNIKKKQHKIKLNN